MFSEKINNFKKRVFTRTFYVTKWKWQVFSTRNEFLVAGKRYLDCILAEPEEGCQRCLKALLQQFCYKKMCKKYFFMLPFNCHVV